MGVGKDICVKSGLDGGLYMSVWQVFCGRAYAWRMMGSSTYDGYCGAAGRSLCLGPQGVMVVVWVEELSGMCWLLRGNLYI